MDREDSAPMRDMARQTRLWSRWFCLLVSALPIYLALREEIVVGGSSTSRGIRRVVSRADQPWEFWGVVTLAAGAAAVCWWMRSRVVRGLEAQVPRADSDRKD
jgi:hypothetical protein